MFQIGRAVSDAVVGAIAIEIVKRNAPISSAIVEMDAIVGRKSVNPVADADDHVAMKPGGHRLRHFSEYLGICKSCLQRRGNAAPFICVIFRNVITKLSDGIFPDFFGLSLTSFGIHSMPWYGSAKARPSTDAESPLEVNAGSLPGNNAAQIRPSGPPLSSQRPNWKRQ